MRKTKKPARKTSRKKARKTPQGWARVKNGARYLPAIIIASFATVLSWYPQLGNQPAYGVLAYATNTSPAGLLSATNSRRASAGTVSLVSNSLLNSAAQAKANHMVANDYWAHVSPDGTQPWAFITATGYKYVSAGENLAYGYLSSGDTVTGWMNSPSHKANLLSSSYTEVGFGIANSSNFVGDGPQTVVVAMYGSPQVAGATTSSPSNASPAPEPKSQPVAAPATEEPAAEQARKPKEEPAKDEETIAIAPQEETNTVVATAAPAKTGRIQLLTGGAAAWSATAVILLVSATGILWMTHKGIRIKKFVMAGEDFVIHHPQLDLAVLAIIYLGFVLLTTSGYVR